MANTALRAIGFCILPASMVKRIPAIEYQRHETTCLASNEVAATIFSCTDVYELLDSSGRSKHLFSSSGASWAPLGAGGICINDNFCSIVSGAGTEILATRPSTRQFFIPLNTLTLDSHQLNPTSISYSFPYILLTDRNARFMAMTMGPSVKYFGNILRSLKLWNSGEFENESSSLDTKLSRDDGLASFCMIGSVQSSCIYFDPTTPSKKGLFLIAEPKRIRLVSPYRVETMLIYVPETEKENLQGWPSHLSSITMDPVTFAIFVVDSIHGSVVSINGGTASVIRCNTRSSPFSPEFISLGLNRNVIVREQDGNLVSIPIQVPTPSAISAQLQPPQQIPSSSQESRTPLLVIPADVWSVIAEYFDSVDLLRLQMVNRATRNIFTGRTHLNLQTNRQVLAHEVFGPYLARAPFLNTFEFSSTHIKPTPLLGHSEFSSLSPSLMLTEGTQPWTFPPYLADLTLDIPLSLDDPPNFSTLHNLTILQLPQLDRVSNELLRGLPRSLTYLSLPSAVPGLSLMMFPPRLQYLDIRRMQLRASDVPSEATIKRNMKHNKFSSEVNHNLELDDLTDDIQSSSEGTRNFQDEAIKMNPMLADSPFALLPHLRILNISSATLWDSDLVNLPKNLIELNLRHAEYITDEGIKKLPRGIQRLHLGSTRQLTDLCASDFPPALTSLDVNHNTSLTDQFFATLSSTEPIVTGLKELFARDSAMTIFCLPFIELFINLEYLKPSKAFIKDLKCNLLQRLPRKLKTLDLSGNRVLTLMTDSETDVPFQPIDYSLHFPPTLTSLSMGQDAGVRDEEFKFFPPELKTLDLGRCTNITAKGLLRLRDQCPQLEAINISQASNLVPEDLSGLPSSITSIELPNSILNALSPSNFDFLARYNLTQLKITSRLSQLDSSVFWMIPRTVTDFVMPLLRKVLPIHIPSLPPGLTKLDLSGVEDLSDDAICDVVNGRRKCLLSHLLVSLDFSSSRAVTPLGVQDLHLLRDLRLGVDEENLALAASRSGMSQEAALGLLPRKIRYLRLSNYPGLRTSNFPHLNELLNLIVSGAVFYMADTQSHAASGDSTLFPKNEILSRLQAIDSSLVPSHTV